MRSDISKVLVERPRCGGSNESKRSYRAHWRHNPEYPCPRGMKRMHSSHPKELNENLKPLMRYLHSQVGRKWNDIYSEICSNLNRNNAVQFHVFQHLFHYVCTHVQIIDGMPYDMQWNRYIESSVHGYKELYVDPRDGVLKIGPNRKRYRFNLFNGSVHKIKSNNSNVYYCEVNSIWYEVEFKPLEFSYPPETYYDILFKDYVGHSVIMNRYGANKIGIPFRKTQLNKREIKRLGLRDRN